MLSSLLRAVTASDHDNLMGVISQRGRTQLWSACEPSVGKSLLAAVQQIPSDYSEEQFAEVLRWRLGLVTNRDVPKFANVAAKSASACGEAVDHSVTMRFPAHLTR